MWSCCCAWAGRRKRWQRRSASTDAEAVFWRAVCLESLGRRRDEARRGYEEYLRHGDIERRGEATRKLGKLGKLGMPAP